LKEELGMKENKDEEEDNEKFCSLKMPMDHNDKGSKKYGVNIKKCDTETPEEFLRCKMTLNKHIKNHGYTASYDTVMNLAQSMLEGRG
jgi:hypothetical protein